MPIVRSVVDVDELVLDRRSAAQPDIGRGRAWARPVHVPAARREQVGLHELAHGFVEPVAEPARVVGRERQLVRRARDLRAEHERVLRVHDRALGRAAGELGRMRDVPLVELVVAGDEHRGRAPVGAARAPGLLPHRRQRAREAVEHDRVEAADVDAELERVRGRDAEQPPARELELELAALRREVAGPVRGDPRAEPGLDLLEPRARVLRDELGAAAAAGERERRVAGAHEAGEQLGGLDVGRRARAGVLVEQRALPAREHALGTRRSVVVDLLDREAAQLARRARPGLPIVALAKQNVGFAP